MSRAHHHRIDNRDLRHIAHRRYQQLTAKPPVFIKAVYIYARYRAKLVHAIDFKQTHEINQPCAVFAMASSWKFRAHFDIHGDALTRRPEIRRNA